MKFKRLALLSSALLLGLSTLAVVTPKAFAATRTWDGGGGDDNMNTAANWTGDVAPTAGDDLVFPANQPRLTITNNYTAATSFNSITFSGAATQDSQYTISGNSMVVVAGITNSMTTSGSFSIGQSLSTPITMNTAQNISAVSEEAYVYLGGVVSGSGNITKTGIGSLILDATNTYTGTTTVSAGTILMYNAAGLGASSAGTTVADGGSLSLAVGNTTATISEPLTFNGSAAAEYEKLQIRAGSGLFDANPTTTLTLDGAVNLGSNMTLRLFGANLTMPSVTLNSYTISVADGSFGTVTVNGTAMAKAARSVTTITDSQPTEDIAVGNNQKYIVNGQRQNAEVYFDGILSGTGTLATITTRSGATLAPGTSPGCLLSGNVVLVSGSIYEAELAGTTVCSQYDQTQVTGTVDLGSATLSTVLLNDFKPAKGNTFTIIANDGSDAVTGTFANLAQGATFAVNGYVFQISYTGGDGNDVVATVQSVPSSPDTGFTLMKNNPLATLVITIVLGGSLLILARRYSHGRQ